MKKTLSLGLAAALAGIYLIPLCPNLEMLAGGGIERAMCAKETSCCSAEQGEPSAAPSCCDTTILAFERLDGVSSDAPLLAPPALAAISWPEAAAILADAEAVFGSPSVRYLSPPPLLLSLRL